MNRTLWKESRRERGQLIDNKVDIILRPILCRNPSFNNHDKLAAAGVCMGLLHATRVENGGRD